MLTLRGAPAYSAFRLEKLAQRLSTLHPDIQILHQEYVHFADVSAPLSDAQAEVLESLLTYGPPQPPRTTRWLGLTLSWDWP